MNIREVAETVVAPGELFEVQPVSAADGLRAFTLTPPTLRDFFVTSHGITDTFVVFEDEEWSFDRVIREADTFGYHLVQWGVRKGDRVGIAMRNYPEWIAAFAAVTSVGAVVVSLNAWWSAEELTFALDDSTPTVLLVDDARLARIDQAARARAIRVVCVRGGDDLADDVVAWGDLVREYHELPVVDLGPDDDATILYTSGTTGVPKGAVSTHGALCQAIMAFSASVAIQDRLRPTGQQMAGQPLVFILVVPLFHVTGCVPIMLTSFSWHFKIVMLHRWDPLRALELIERHAVTTFAGVPTQAWDLLECPEFSRFDTSSLRSIGGGGAPAPARLVDRVAQAFSRGGPLIVYGMTETNAYGPANFDEDYEAHPTSTGVVPTVVMDVEIRDAAAMPLPTNATGEIWLRSPTLVRGYWNREAATAETIVNGWLRTGDVGRIDADGYLYVEDRIKDVILRGGENVYSAEVESAIYEHPAVYEAAVFGVPDERLGEEVACAIVLKPGATLDVGELQAFLGEHIATFMVPTKVVVSKEPLPRTETGKLVKRRMAARYFPSK